MKFLCILAVCLALVAADDDPKKADATQGRTGSKANDAKGNTRFFGLGIGGRPVRPVGGFGGRPVRPVGGFGGRPVGGFGVSPGFGASIGVNPGFGVVNPGFGGGFGGNVGFGGGNAGFGGVNNGFGAGFGVNQGFAPVAPPSSCRFWCRTPQGQAYCCENVNQPQSFTGVVKPGFCPPVRPVCPPVRSFAPPASCSSDGSCGGVDKCCFDTCLQQHTCKPPQGFGR